MRYAVSYNGALTIRETRAPDFDFEAIILQAENDPDTDWEAFWEKYIQLKNDHQTLNQVMVDELGELTVDS